MKKIFANKPRLSYHWVIVLATVLISAGGLGFHNNVSLYVIPVTETLGVSRGQFTFFRTLSMLTGACLLPFYARLSRRYNIKHIMLVGTTVCALIFMSYSLATQLWHFYALGILYGVFVNGSQFMLLGILVNRWFVDKRGLALGIAFAGSGVGASIMIPMVSRVIEHYGWERGFQFTGLASLAVLLPTIIFLVKESPESMGLAPYRVYPTEITGDAPSPTPVVKTHDLQGISLRQARRQPIFWVLLLVLMFTAIGASVPNTHGLPHFIDLGHEPEFAALIASTVMMVLIGSKIWIGIVFDKHGTLVGSLTIGAFAILVPVFALLGAHGTHFLWLYSVAFGISSAGYSIPIGIYTAKYFGQREFPALLSLFSMSLAFASASAVPLMGLVFDTLGSYTVGWYVLLGLAVAMVVGASVLHVMERGRETY